MIGDYHTVSHGIAGPLPYGQLGGAAQLRPRSGYGTTYQAQGSTFTSQQLNQAGGMGGGSSTAAGAAGGGIVGAVVGAIADIVKGITGSVTAGQNKKAAMYEAQAAGSAAAMTSMQAAQAAKIQQSAAEAQARAALYSAAAARAQAQAQTQAQVMTPQMDYTPLVVTAAILTVGGVGAAFLLRKKQ